MEQHERRTRRQAEAGETAGRGFRAEETRDPLACRSTGMAEDADRGSCGTPVRLRWRAEQKLGSGESFDDMHGSTADRTLP